MLTPVPTVSETEQDPSLSFNFSEHSKYESCWSCVPVIYGEVLMVGSVVISAGIETAQVEV